jgi:protein-ribulosamine 3-kinase
VGTALPPGVARWLADEHGGARVVGSVGGGCINPAVRLRLPQGDLFLKFNSHAPAGTFAVEAEGLQALRAAAPLLRVPEVLGVWEDAERSPGAACLLLEWLEPARPGPGYDERLGRGLAQLHRGGEAGWGWHRDGFIGPLPQPNAPVKSVPECMSRVPSGTPAPDGRVGAAGSWAWFWIARRLEPQLRRARDAGRYVGRERDWEVLWQRLPDLLAPAEADGPSLLHGDLWSGNVLATAERAGEGGGAEPALVDPAAYRGHREVDLAMAELFGGFGSRCLDAYHEAWPLQPGYRPGRRAAYQLFYLLVHVNLFGSGYVPRTEQALRDALTA